MVTPRILSRATLALGAVLTILGCEARGQARPTRTAMVDAAPMAGADSTRGKPSDAELRKRLTEVQYEVTQHDATEPPFRNAFWDNHEAGIYVDIVSGEPLFSSLDKYESGTGWPSFTRPLEPRNLKTQSDHQLMEDRTEVRSARANSHLGHVFTDGPRPTGLRYCMNSAALRFIPASKLREAGYTQYERLFAAQGGKTK